MAGRMRWTTPKPIKWVVEMEHDRVTILRLSTLNEIFFIKSMFGIVFDVEKSWTSRIIRECSSGIRRTDKLSLWRGRTLERGAR